MIVSNYARAAEVTEKAAFTSAGGTIGAGLSLNEWAIAIGIVATIVTLLMNWYYKQKHLELAREHFKWSASEGADE